MEIRYKFLRDNLKSENGNCKWVIGKWKKLKGEPKLCENGFHCSKTKYQAFSYIQGELLAEVEVRGKSDISDDKECWSEMRLIKVWKWQKKDSVALAIYSAEQYLKNFESKYPNDKRPRKAIQATKKWLKNPTKENESAAESAARSAAWSARSAARSARSAARSAESAAWSAAWSAAASAAWSARSAAASAAWSARSAASAAESAAWSAWSAAWSAAIMKITNWIEKRELEPYDN
jgi:hypothetical protein